jgi:hypothetical protein
LKLSTKHSTSKSSNNFPLLLHKPQLSSPPSIEAHYCDCEVIQLEFKSILISPQGTIGSGLLNMTVII